VHRRWRRTRTQKTYSESTIWKLDVDLHIFLGEAGAHPGVCCLSARFSTYKSAYFLARSLGAPA